MVGDELSSIIDSVGMQSNKLSQIRIFTLSKFVLIPILSQWLELKEFGRLDSAVCNNWLRQALFRLVSNDALAFRDSLLFFAPLSPNLFPWATSRGFCAINGLILDDRGAFSCEESKFICSDFYNIDRLKVVIGLSVPEEHIRKTCFVFKWVNRIKELYMINTYFSSLLQCNGLFPCLRVCSLFDCHDLRETTVIVFCRGHPLLETLIVEGCDNITGQLMRCVVVHNRHLKHLNVKGCYKIAKRGMIIVQMHASRALGVFSYDQH